MGVLVGATEVCWAGLAGAGWGRCWGAGLGWRLRGGCWSHCLLGCLHSDNRGDSDGLRSWACVLRSLGLHGCLGFLSRLA